MAELAYAHDSGSCEHYAREGSSPSNCTKETASAAVFFCSMGSHCGGEKVCRLCGQSLAEEDPAAYAVSAPYRTPRNVCGGIKRPARARQGSSRHAACLELSGSVRRRVFYPVRRGAPDDGSACREMGPHRFFYPFYDMSCHKENCLIMHIIQDILVKHEF